MIRAIIPGQGMIASVMMGRDGVLMMQGEILRSPARRTNATRRLLKQ